MPVIYSSAFGSAGGLASPQKPEVVEESGDPLCPYCQALLKKRPQRKTKCPGCKQFIYVKHTPTEPIRRLVTEARAKEIEALWAARNDALEQTSRDTEARRFGLPAGLSSEALVAALIDFGGNQRKELSDRKQAFSLASYRGRKLISLAKLQRIGEQIFRLDLEILADLGGKKAALRGGLDPCPSCKRLVGDGYVIADRLASDPVPNRNCYCWREFATCCAFWAQGKSL